VDTTKIGTPEPGFFHFGPRLKQNLCLAPDQKNGWNKKKLQMVKKSIWHHKLFWSFLSKNGITCRFLEQHTTSFFPQKMVPGCKQEWNREAVTIFSRLPSLRRLQATPPLQSSLVLTIYENLLMSGLYRLDRGSNDEFLL
jgi:hypothetical protein